jgi:hypothetical protein
MPERVVFYKLSHKYVSTEANIPAESKQIIYYSLAIGHHLGVVDCFSRVLEMGYNEFASWVNAMPDRAGRHKLEGICKWGEIEINQSHAGELIETLAASRSQMSPQEVDWADQLIACLQGMLNEPAFYAIARSDG